MPKAKSTALIGWQERMEKDSKIGTARESATAVGDSFSTQGGTLSFQGVPVPNNTMAVVIVDAIIHNANYPDAFDPKNPSGPDCFAFGRDEAELAPHAVAVEAGTARAASCAECPLNEWGSSDKGTGKACGNGRRLALIPAGELDDNGGFTAPTDPEELRTAGIGYLKVPAASLKGYAGFVKILASSLKRPEYGVYTQITLEGTKLIFKSLEKVSEKMADVVIARHDEAMDLIEYPYPAYQGAPTKKGKTAPRAAAPKAAGFGRATKLAPQAKAAAPAAKAPKAKAPAPKAAPVAKGFVGKPKVSKF